MEELLAKIAEIVRERDELRNEVECLTALNRALALDLDAAQVLARKFNAMTRAARETR